MNLSQLLMEQTMVMFFIMAIGYFIRRMNLIQQGGKDLSVVLINLALPMVILDTFISAGSEAIPDLGLSFALALITLGISMGIAFLVYGRKQAIENFGTSFSNAGFMGLPLVEATLGGQAVIYVTGILVLLNVFQWTYGVVLLSENFDSIKIKKLVKNPIIIFASIGIFLVLTGLKLPATVTSTITMFKAMNTPLAMIIIGISLADTNISECFTKLAHYKVAAVRLILIPLATMAIFSVLPFFSREMLMAVMIVACAPIGSNIAIAAQMYEKDYKQAIQMVCLSTILSIITIPFMMQIAEMFI